jgi:hypothetical protein
MNSETPLLRPAVISGAISVLVVLALSLLLIWAAAYLLERSLDATHKMLKMAFKAEFTTEVGRLNAILMFLFTFLIVFSNLHEMLANAMKTESGQPVGGHWIVTILMCGLFFQGSIFSVILLERKRQ